MAEGGSVRRKPGERIKWTEVKIYRLRRMWGDTAFSVADIARALDIGATTVAKQARNLGLGPRDRKRHVWTEERVAVLKSEWDDPALSNEQIARQEGLNRQQLSVVAARFRFGPRPAVTLKRKRFTARDDAQIRELWPDTSVSIPEIGRRMNRHPGSIANRAKQVLKLPPRSGAGEPSVTRSVCSVPKSEPSEINAQSRIGTSGRSMRPMPTVITAALGEEIRPLDAIDQALMKDGASYAGRAKIAEAHEISSNEILRRWHRVARLMRQGVN